MEKFDYLNKEEVKSFVYSTISENRQSTKNECINGRWYTKYGTLQALTFAGRLYKVFNFEKNKHEYVLHVGMSKQHPNDSHINKQLAIEVAFDNCLMSPIIEMAFETEYIPFDMFRDIVQTYSFNLDLKFIRTREEKKNIK